MIKPQLSFRSEKQISFLSRNIAQNFANRGHSWTAKIQTILRDFKEELEMKSLKELSEEKIQEYVSELKESVENGDIKAETAQTYISALNSIIDYTNYVRDTNFNSVSAAENGIHSSADYADKSVSPETHQSFQNFLEERYDNTGDERFQALELATELQREFGLRFRESAGLNIFTVEKALETGKLELSREDWTKNARERVIEIRTEEQKELLSNVKDFLENQKSVNLAGADNWKDYNPIASFRSFADYNRQEFNQTYQEQYNFHGERHFWAQERYSQLWEEKVGIRIEAPIKYYSEQLQQAGWDGSGKFYDAVLELNIKPFWEYVQEEILSTKQEELNFPDLFQSESSEVTSEPDIFSLNEQPEQQEYTQENLLEMPDLSDLFEIDKEIRLEISEELGHSRLDITNTYLGHP
ncbi:MAG TPA: hypothetical protein ENJ27_01145 [Candidatus Moranbacteria bacterium]|nr:hypothetical protein [Candidatus Moranbacteria bacterium]